MEFTDSGNSLICLFLLIAIPLFVGFLLFFAGFGAMYRRKCRRRFFLTVITAILAAASWFLNFGWYRVFLTVIPIPLLYFTLFVVLGLVSVGYADASEKLRKYTVISHVLFLLSYFLFPDVGDTGTAYVFFSLIHHPWASYLLTPAMLCCASCLVLLVLQMVEVGKARKTDVQKTEKI